VIISKEALRLRENQKMSLKIGSVDSWPGFQLEKLGPARYLISRYGAVVSNDAPDILFCDIFHIGSPERKESRYARSLKILCSGENILRKPIDWDDFALVFSCNVFDDQAKFLHTPYPVLNSPPQIFERRLLGTERLKFMNFVVSNSMENFAGCNFRERLFEAFEKEYGRERVHSAGKHLNNCGENAPRVTGDYFSLNVDPHWLSQYQFSICGENQLVPGYYTEKPIQAWIAGSIPIYLTHRDNLRWLNEKAGIFGYGPEDIPGMAERVKNLTVAEIETMRAQPLFRYSPAKLQRRMERRLERMMAVWLTVRGKEKVYKAPFDALPVSEICWAGESGARKFKMTTIGRPTITLASFEARGLAWSEETYRELSFAGSCAAALNQWPADQNVILVIKGPARFHPNFLEELEKMLNLDWAVCFLSYSVSSWAESTWVKKTQSAFMLKRQQVLQGYAVLLRREALAQIKFPVNPSWSGFIQACLDQNAIFSFPPLLICTGEDEQFFKQFKVEYR
jgi:hypothetical protein